MGVGAGTLHNFFVELQNSTYGISYVDFPNISGDLNTYNTGRGQITGDGIIGLSRAWISAGVSSVIVSLWLVPEQSTSTLMTNFYQNRQKNPDKAQALRQAMLQAMKQNPNPRDWAAFTLIGEAE